MSKLGEIRTSFNRDLDWGMYDGVLSRNDIRCLLNEVEVLQNSISMMESDKINYEMNLEHVTAELDALKADIEEGRLVRIPKCTYAEVVCGWKALVAMKEDAHG